MRKAQRKPRGCTVFAAIALVFPSGICGQCFSPPEAQGIDSVTLSRGLEKLVPEVGHLHSLIVARNGCVVVEAYWPPYRRDTMHYLNSATKAVLSGLVGIAVQQGRMSESGKVVPLLGNQAGPMEDARWNDIEVRHLLTMSSGISWRQAPPDNTSDSMGHSQDWVRFILRRPMEAPPGQLVNYSNGDAHLLGAALQKAVGKTALEFARSNLFSPLKISEVAWDTDPQGRSIGSAALQMRPLDLVKVGLLYLQEGQFDGKRILDAGWVRRSLTEHVKMPSRGGAVGYGYYWWLYPERHVAEAWGGAGQRIGLIHDLNAVVVMTANDPGDYPRSSLAARIYDLVRESVKGTRSLTPNPEAVSALQRSVSEMTARR